MHATRDTTDFIFGWVAGGRVMRGVRLLLRYNPLPIESAAAAGGEGEMSKASPVMMSGLTSVTAGGGRHGVGRMSALTKRDGGRWAKDGPQSNMGMHPTAHPTDFMFLNRWGAAGDAWRSAAPVLKSQTEAREWQWRAALS
jgi:hypothetical protein